MRLVHSSEGGHQQVGHQLDCDGRPDDHDSLSNEADNSSFTAMQQHTNNLLYVESLNLVNSLYGYNLNDNSFNNNNGGDSANEPLDLSLPAKQLRRLLEAHSAS